MIEILLAACLLALALIAGLLLAIQNRLRQAVRSLSAIRKVKPPPVPEPDRNLWRQTSSLLALYRVIDGHDWVPTLRGADLSPDFLLHVALHIQRELPRVIVECGCGTSTIVMAHALAKAGIKSHIYCLEEHPVVAEETSRELARRNFDHLVTIIVAPLTERRYPGFETAFHWYDLRPGVLPAHVNMLLVGGPRTPVNEAVRYPAGPELLPSLAPTGYIFVPDANEQDQLNLRRQWRALYPDLGIRTLATEGGAFEMYFLDTRVKPFMQDVSRGTDAA